MLLNIRRIVNISFILTIFLALASCGGDSPDSPSPIPTPTPTPTPTPEPVRKEIKINVAMGATRANDNAFETGDKVGLYVVNYSGSTPGTLRNSGNHVDNMRFTLSGTWNPDSKIYWKDDETHADFYVCYPYASINSVNAIPFNVATDQSSEQKYRAADFMCGKTSDVAPSESAVSITANHLMSQIRIELAAGTGFSTESLKAANISIKINKVLTQSTIDLATSTVTPTGTASSVTAWKDGEIFRAFVVPQTVEECELITVNVDGQEFNLSQGAKFESGKLHKLTVTLNQGSTGINVGINPWDTSDSFTGTAE